MKLLIINVIINAVGKNLFQDSKLVYIHKILYRYEEQFKNNLSPILFEFDLNL